MVSPRLNNGVQMAAVRGEVTQAMSQAVNPEVPHEMQALRTRRDHLQEEVTQLHQQLQPHTHSVTEMREEQQQLMQCSRTLRAYGSECDASN
eukprot:4830687-Amphidinium_carterae.7